MRVVDRQQQRSVCRQVCSQPKVEAAPDASAKGHVRSTLESGHHCRSGGPLGYEPTSLPIKQRYLSGSLAAVGEAAGAIECETKMRSKRSDGRVVLRIRI